MKYPSVFFSILFAWISVIIITLWLGDRELTYQLYLSGVIFSVIMFVVGFWRNR